MSLISWNRFAARMLGVASAKARATTLEADRTASVPIHVDRVQKSFGSFRALSDVSLTFDAGALTVLLGPSGSGKTTLLRSIAGIEVPDSGHIRFGEEDVTLKPIREREVGFVFQSYALFEHLNVFDNVAFGLSVRGRPKAEIKARVTELLTRVELVHLGHRLPRELSGGQRQRVALARALAPHPRVLLLDEPFGALDARVRRDLRAWLRRLHSELHVTTVLVTHDQDEAFEVADNVVVMHEGKIEQVGTPRDLIHRPATDFVRSFVEKGASIDPGAGI